MDVPPRTAQLVLVDRDGTVIGQLPPVPCAARWWPEAADIVDAARAAFGIEIVVLRLLGGDRPGPPGGEVTYAAELRPPLGARGAAALEAMDPACVPLLADHPLRLPWARPGGPDRDVHWAEEVLRARRIEQAGPAVQVRTWNLSSLWRLPLADGTSAWLKAVPPFFAHEGAMLRRLQGRDVPRLIGHDGHRVLMSEIPGEDRYAAPLDEVLRMVELLVGIQAEWVGRTDDLVAMGLPDWRGPALTRALEDLLDRRSPEIPGADAARLGAFVAGLPGRFAEVDACGLPDTLVHGDFHAGNVRGDGARLTLLDWGDCGVGHPLLDMAAMLDERPADEQAAIVEHWIGAWRAALPGADPARAAELMRPVAEARQPLIYDRFLAGIEPTEHPYHASDPAEWLRRTAELLA
jgi:hypothetical protein